MEDKKHVICPNCHAGTHLDKKAANSWRTMDPLESIVAGIAPVFLAGVTVCICLALCRVNAIRLDYKVLATVFLGVIILTIPVFVWLLNRYEKNRRAADGYEVYWVQCPCCKNAFRIVRPTCIAAENPVVEHYATEQASPEVSS